ncbi:hypothetical protein HK405_003094 [Cladochytrium tenue]|nr:hypothetical protein HK405_003094 [Cladochytrium tenue]
MTDCFCTALSEIEASVPALQQKATAVVLGRCCASLQKDIRDMVQKSQFSRQQPTTSSPYVSEITRPLATTLSFIEKHLTDVDSEPLTSALPMLSPQGAPCVGARIFLRISKIPSASLTWAVAAAKRVSQPYHADLSKTLQDIEEREKYFRNRRRQKGGAAGSGGSEESLAVAGTDKVRIQAQLDVRQYLVELAAMGVQAERLPSSALLRDLLNSTDADKSQAAS